MKDRIISWQPPYRVIHLPNDNLIVISAHSEFLFEHTAFPLFHLIDGKKTLSEIASHAKSQQDLMRFYAVCEHFLAKKQYITDTNNVEKPRLLNKITSVGKRLFSNLDIGMHTHIFDVEHVQLFISDNLISTCKALRYIDGVKSDWPICIVAITDTYSLISPILSSIQDADSLAQALEPNKPVLQFVKAYSGADFTIPAPIKRDACTEKFFRSLNKIIVQHVSDQKRSRTLIEYNHDTHHIETHPYQPPTAIHKLDAKISLSSQPVTSDDDGGSRCVSAEQTVEKLKPFISPITGQITHIEKLPQPQESSISIFKTAFFKSLPIKYANTIDNNSFVQICLGKGISEAQSKASALCETIERKNAQYRHIPPSIFATQSKLPHRSYHFNQLVPYSDQQYIQFADLSNAESNRTQAVLAFNDGQIHWQQVWSLTHNDPVYLPYVSCFANTPYEEDVFGKWHSNGCAAGNNLEEAIMQGLFELLERDAIAIWWYNKLPRPSYDLTTLDTHYYTQLDQTISVDYEYWVLDITLDTGVPVMAAIGKNKQTAGWIFGFGCHLKPHMAAQRALTELCQLIPIRDQSNAPFDFDAIDQTDFLMPHDNYPAISPKLKPSKDLKLDIFAIVEQLQSLGMETLALNYSQEFIPIKTANVFVPGLCHIWPQLGNPRLYETPVKLGLMNTALNEATVNQQGLYL
ncbi:YcaO-like family protein [Pseudoalteromonas sp. SMS1]|uniref:YcaO-like family protein n=1 Tax=Pseudoalteromonas sp. SMS1 TaxID=2908894 RepID=UPI001F42C93B|nr:YcaO-like family protein [Pseudoalteromonas sp. SMS1]MCF2858201.1 YcaO-like family protein [Pseudoalteromonas sp. SMS1]